MVNGAYMPLYSDDYAFLNSVISRFKRSFFQLVSDFGPNYNAKFMLSFSDIKYQTNRERLTSVTLRDYEDYLSEHGFIVENGRDAFLLTINARTIVTVGNESIDLANALSTFRSRALLNGDVDNM